MKTHNACVYWIHLPEHTDIFTQGYIGVTRKGLKERFKGHLKKASLGAKGRFPSAIRKYGDVLVKSVILIAEEKYCYDIEEKLRPSSYIGWNAARGGMHSNWQEFQEDPEKREKWITKLREANLGKPMPDSAKEKVATNSKLMWEREEFSTRMREITQERRVVRKPQRPRFWSKSGTSLLISRADEVYDIYTENPQIFSREIVENLGLSGQNYVRSVTKLTQKFFSGWNPHEDLWWQVDFNGLPIEQLPAYLRFEEAWGFYNSNTDTWLQADKIYELHVNLNKSKNFISDELGLKESQIKNICNRVKEGWVPLEDPRWVKWRDEQLALNDEHKETPTWQLTL